MRKLIVLSMILLLLTGCRDILYKTYLEKNESTKQVETISSSKVEKPKDLIDNYLKLGDFLYNTVSPTILGVQVTEKQWVSIVQQYPVLLTSMDRHVAMIEMKRNMEELYNITNGSVQLDKEIVKLEDNVKDKYSSVWNKVVNDYTENIYYIIEDYYTQQGLDAQYTSLVIYRDSISARLQLDIESTITTMLNNAKDETLVLTQRDLLLEKIHKEVGYPSTVQWVNNLYMGLSNKEQTVDDIINMVASIQGEILTYTNKLYEGVDKDKLIKLELNKGGN